MIGPMTVVSIIAVIGALVLAVRGLRSYNLPFERKAWMAGIWVVIIVGLALVLSRLGK